MSCHLTDEQIWCYLNNDLTQEEMIKIEQILSECPDCAKNLNAEKDFHLVFQKMVQANRQSPEIEACAMRPFFCKFKASVLMLGALAIIAVSTQIIAKHLLYIPYLNESVWAIVRLIQSPIVVFLWAVTTIVLSVRFMQLVSIDVHQHLIGLKKH